MASQKPERTALKVGFETEPDKNLRVMALAFDAKGNLLDSQPVEKGVANLNLSEKGLRQAQIFLTPIPPGTETVPKTIEAARKLRAWQPVFNPALRIPDLFIPGGITAFWNWRFCRAVGRVTKKFTLDGRTVERPLCKARVHICEIDRIPRWWEIPRPDFLRLSDLLRDLVIEPRIPIPRPPRPEPWPIFEAVSMESIQPGFRRLAMKSQPFQSILTDFGKMEAKNAVLQLDESVQAHLLSGNAARIELAVKNNFVALRPLFCITPWFWRWFYRCDEIATVLTDANGRFDVPFLYHKDDQPDLYFWVEYLINGVWTTVYRPSKPCHTFWNYACGTEVHLNVTDVRVPWPSCGDEVPDSGVWVRSIGATSVREVEQTDASPLIQGQAFNTNGMANVENSLGLGLRINPFGGGLNLWVLFGGSLPSAGVAHYRWSYRRVRDGRLNPFLNTLANPIPWIPFTAPIGKTYTILNAATLADPNDRVSVNFPLGPVLANNLFKIPPEDPKTAAVSGNPSAIWGDTNTLTASFPTTGFDDGLYEFKLELFNQAGNLVEVDPTVFQIPMPGDPGSSEMVQAPYFIAGSGGNVAAFKMNVRIDNNHCAAEIQAVHLTTNPAAVQNCCGFLNYIDGAQLIRVSFRASHLNDLATYSFHVVKGQGSGNSVAPALAGGLITTGTNGFTRSGDLYWKDIAARDLLGTCADGHVCTKAAFAEHLSVYGLATNGHSRINYDAGDLDAFAIEP